MLVFSLLPVFIWIALLLGRGGFWRINSFMLPVRVQDAPARSVAVIIPARNESDVIGKAIASLLSQHYEGSLSIFVVDDDSEDGTAEAANRAAANAPTTTHVSVVRSRALPHGWTGKMWAVAQGVDAALAINPDYLLLTDADIHHPAKSVSTLLSLAEAQDLSLASVMVKLKTDTVAEKALIPAFTFFFFLLYPPAFIRSSQRKTAGAAGGCILVRPAALANGGGIAAIRNQIIDDCALARLIKRSGGRVWLGISSDIASLRGYGQASAVGSMIARTAYNQLHHSPLLLAGTLAGLFVTFLLPFCVLLDNNSVVRTSGVVAWLLMTIAFLPTVRFHRLHRLWAGLLPVAAVFYAGATIYSAIRFHAGCGGKWKGRTQDSARAS